MPARTAPRSWRDSPAPSAIDVERSTLSPYVVERRAVPQNDFGHAVRERPGRPAVFMRLDDGRARPVPQDDQDPGRAHHRAIARALEAMRQPDGSRDFDPGRDRDHLNVIEEGRGECRKRVGGEIRVASQVRVGRSLGRREIADQEPLGSVGLYAPARNAFSERGLRQRPHIREPPGLLTGGREPDLGKAGGTLLPQLGEPVHTPT